MPLKLNLALNLSLYTLMSHHTRRLTNNSHFSFSLASILTLQPYCTTPLTLLLT